jgi:hypothetical protein
MKTMMSVSVALHIVVIVQQNIAKKENYYQEEYRNERGISSG